MLVHESGVAIVFATEANRAQLIDADPARTYAGMIKSKLVRALTEALLAEGPQPGVQQLWLVAPAQARIVAEIGVALRKAVAAPESIAVCNVQLDVGRVTPGRRGRRAASRPGVTQLELQVWLDDTQDAVGALVKFGASNLSDISLTARAA